MESRRRSGSSNRGECVSRSVGVFMKVADLVESFPPASEAVVGDDLDHRARAVLRILLDRLPAVELPPSIAPNVDTCPNCDRPVASFNTPYCSDCCRERAAFIRQMRDSIANDSLLDPHRQTMKGEQMWRLLGGGLPRRLALVPENARARVFKKAEGKCELCGAPATRIDNTGSG